MIDHAQRQRAVIYKEGLKLIEEDVSLEAFVMGAHRRKWPVGARHFWALSQVWAPRNAAMPEQKEPAQ